MSTQQPCKACGRPRLNSGVWSCTRSSRSAMRAKPKSGCVTCAVLSEAVDVFFSNYTAEDKPRNGKDDLEFRLEFDMRRGNRSLEICILGTDIALTLFCTGVTPWLSETFPDIPVEYEVPANTYSLEGLSWALDQIQKCEQSHPTCNAASQDSPLPTRVIDVGTADDNQPHIRLYESKGERGEPYICLSHCWGPRPFLRTLSGSLESHKRSLDWNHLPQTFQDAIEYTRKLGVRYLWIDSLCIIQDDQQDWRLEAAKMASIYQGSFLVLSAAKSPNAYGGLFTDFPRKSKTHTLEFTSPNSTTPEKIHIRQRFNHANSGLLNMRIPLQRTALPTLTRGWIFQERFLSPRILHFGPEELSWECLETSTCQCSPPPLSDKFITMNPNPVIPTWYQHMVNHSSRPKSYYNPFVWEIMPPVELTTCWHRLVEDYTGLSLTYEKDIFPGISGLARQFQRASRDSDQNPAQYIAGLWGHSLHRDLLWHVEGDGLSSSFSEETATGRRRLMDRLATWRAPSWSWASVRGQVAFVERTEGLEVRCDIFGEVECVPAGPDPMGELVEVEGKNVLWLKGRVIPALLRLKKGKRVGDRDRKDSWEVIELDILEGHLKNVWGDDGCEWLFEWVDGRRLRGEDGKQVPSLEVFCLLVGVKTTKALCFLILNKLEGAGEESCYKRIGVAEVFGGPPGPGSWVDRLLNLGDQGVVCIG